MRDQPTMILVGWDIAVAEWVRQRVYHVETWGPFTAIGVVRGSDLIAGIVYNNFRWPTMEASIASTDASWCSRRNLAAIFAYPFRQCECTRLGATTEATNQPVRAFLGRLGFREEGLLKSALPDRADAVIFGMTPEECRWLGNTPGDVKGRQPTSTAAG